MAEQSVAHGAAGRAEYEINVVLRGPVNGVVRPQRISKAKSRQCMQYHLYTDSNHTLRVDYTMRRQDAGILGKISTAMEPTASADTKDAVVEMAYAHLGRNPSDTLYVADSQGQLYQIIINKKYHEACDANVRAIAIAWASFTLSIISFVMAVTMELGYTGLLIGGVVLGLYYGAVRWKIFNELEACVVCVVLLVSTMLLVPAGKAFYREFQNRRNNAMHPSR